MKRLNNSKYFYTPPEDVGLEIGWGKITQVLRLAFFLVNYAGGVVKEFQRVVMTKSGFCFREVQAATVSQRQ